MPRITSRAAATLALAALLVVAPVTYAGAEQPPARRLIVVLAPYLTWDDVTTGPMPATRTLAGAGLVANMNVRSGVIGAGPQSVARGALMLSAGTSVLSDPEALASYSASEAVGVWTARDVYRQRFAADPGPSAVLYPGQPQQARANAGNDVASALGVLGAAAHAAGYRTVAIGDSDAGLDLPAALQSRPAGIAVADVAGRVDLGDVSAGLLREGAAPFGVSTDLARLEATYRSAVASSGPVLAVLDPGDLARAHDAQSIATTSAFDAAHAAALRATDDVVAMVTSDLDPARDTLIVLGLTAPESGDQPPAFAPLVIRGPAGAGLATAASTHRDGIVTIMDVSASLVSAMGAPRPATMVGSVIGRAASSPVSLADRVAVLDSMNATAVAIELVRLPLINTYIVLTVLVLLGSALVVYRGAKDLPPATGRVARALLLLVPCLPLASVLQFAFWPRPPLPGLVLAMLLGVALVVWAGALALGRGRPVAFPLIVVTGLTTVVFVVDQWLGAPLSFSGTFGYSPLYGARYYGIGNEMAGLLLGTSMVACALALDSWPEARWSRLLRLWGWPVLGVIVLGSAAAPFLGANIGTVAWMTVGFLTGWLMLQGKRVWTWRNLAIVVAIVILFVVVFAGIDLLGLTGPETHLGRAISDASGSGGLGGLLSIVARKIDTSIRVFGRTNWTWLLLAVISLLGYMRWRPRGEFAALLERYPAFSAALGAALFAGFVGTLTEDSGIIIPALMMIPVGVTALYLMLARDADTEVSAEVEPS